MQQKELMNADDLAKYLSVHTITVYRLIKDTDIPAFKMMGQWRFKKSAIDAWMEKKMKARRAKDIQDVVEGRARVTQEAMWGSKTAV